MKKISFIMTLGVMLTLVACSQQVSVDENTKETTVNIQEQQKAQEAERKAIEESKAKALEESRKESIALEEAKKKAEETTAAKPVETKPAETKPIETTQPVVIEETQYDEAIGRGNRKVGRTSEGGVSVGY